MIDKNSVKSDITISNSGSMVKFLGVNNKTSYFWMHGEILGIQEGDISVWDTRAKGSTLINIHSRRVLETRQKEEILLNIMFHALVGRF